MRILLLMCALCAPIFAQQTLWINPNQIQNHSFKTHKKTYTAYTLGNVNGAPWEIQNVDMPIEMKPAFDAAILKWQEWIQSPQPIKIRVEMADLATEVLAGTDYQLLLHNGYWYPSALGKQLTTMPAVADTMDMVLYLNRKMLSNGSMYFGTEAKPDTEQFDFMTLIIHEITHGLGFAGSLRTFGALRLDGNGEDAPCLDIDGSACFGFKAADGIVYPMKFDSFLYAGTDLLTQKPNPSSALYTALTTGLKFGGANASAVIRDKPQLTPSLYTPPFYAKGSSVNHWHTNINDWNTGQPNHYTVPVPETVTDELMYATQSKGIVVRSLGHFTCGMLQDLGWNTTTQCGKYARFEINSQYHNRWIIGYNLIDNPTIHSLGTAKLQVIDGAFATSSTYETRTFEVLEGLSSYVLSDWWHIYGTYRARHDRSQLIYPLQTNIGYGKDYTSINFIVTPSQYEQSFGFIPEPAIVGSEISSTLRYIYPASGNGDDLNIYALPSYYGASLDSLSFQFDGSGLEIRNENPCLTGIYQNNNLFILRSNNLPSCPATLYENNISLKIKVKKSGNLTINVIPNVTVVPPNEILSFTSRVSDIWSIPLCGDANLDGLVNEQDVSYVADALLNEIPLTPYQLWTANPSGNAHIGGTDIGLLFRKARGGPGKWLCIEPEQGLQKTQDFIQPLIGANNFSLSYTTYQYEHGASPDKPIIDVNVQSLGKNQTETLLFTLESADPNILEFIDLAEDQTGTLAELAFKKIKKISDRKMTLLISSAKPLIGSGALVRLKGKSLMPGNVQISSSPITVGEDRPTVAPPPPSIATISNSDELPKEGLDLVYPNPLQGELKVQYALADNTDISLCIYNVLGQQIKCLINGFEAAGRHERSWDTRGLSNGIYWIWFKTHNQIYKQSFVKIN